MKIYRLTTRGDIFCHSCEECVQQSFVQILSWSGLAVTVTPIGVGQHGAFVPEVGEVSGDDNAVCFRCRRRLVFVPQ